MARRGKVQAALHAMKDIGIPEERTIVVLKKLLQVYERNWELIEQENYRVLADAIFEDEEAAVEDEPERPLKRLRSGQGQAEGPSQMALDASLEKEPKRERTDNAEAGHDSGLEIQHHRNKGKWPISEEGAEVQKQLELQFSERTSHSLHLMEASKDPDVFLSSKQKTDDVELSNKSSDDPVINGAPTFEMPLAVVHPEPSQMALDASSEKEPKPEPTDDAEVQKLLESQFLEERSHSLHRMEASKDPDVFLSSKQKTDGVELSNKSSDDPVMNGVPTFEMPLAVVHPGSSQTTLNATSGKKPKPEPTDDAEVQKWLESEFLERTSNSLHLMEAFKDPEGFLSSKHKRVDAEHSNKSSDDPFIDGVPAFEMPLAMVYTEPLSEAGCSATDSRSNLAPLRPIGTLKPNAINQHIARPSSVDEEQTKSVDPIDVEIASSSLGKVKVSLSFNSIVEGPNVHVPNLDEVMRYMEDNCLSTYKIIDPSFSMKKLMRDFCECFVELATSTSNASLKKQIIVEPAINLIKRSALVADMHDGNPGGGRNLVSSSLYGSDCANCSDNLALVCVSSESSYTDCSDELFQTNEKLATNNSDVRNSVSCLDTNGQILVMAEQSPLNSVDKRCLYDATDLTRGEEKVPVPLVGESMGELSTFHYISESIVYSNARVKFSLARIGDKVCCSTCYGDCRLPSLPCACTYRNGGGFAYTTEGLVTESFLEKYMSEISNPEQNRCFHCKTCPLEKCKTKGILEPCKGHLERKFIKECWTKCGCSRNCVNRVVQRGITCKLQVFWTLEGKGWGLRTIEELPQGAFVCEYAGEILTITELHQRRLQRKNSTRHCYSMVLDAGWDSCSLKDDQALCLDATFYGNVARFINHRCSDSNLVAIPVQVETPDRHYYHVALFSKRKIDAMEELTLDYRVDVDYDQDHLFKPFHCLCGSSFCLDLMLSSSGGSRSQGQNSDKKR